MLRGLDSRLRGVGALAESLPSKAKAMAEAAELLGILVMLALKLWSSWKLFVVLRDKG